MKNRHVIFLFIIAIACAWAYWPGLYGGFLFDDFPNIVQNDRLNAIQDFSIDSLRSAISQREPGPIGRPVSFSTFALNVALTKLDPFFFKLVNLALHLFNGILLFFLIRAILTATNNAVTADWILPVSLFTAGGWLLHPLNLTSVLYVVQRMTELSALFVFLSLLLYTLGRTWQIRGKKGVTWLFAGLSFTSILALFSKENGILIPVYLLILELIIFRFKAQAKTTHQVLKYLYTVLVVLGIPIAAYFLYRHSLDYGNREFTLTERLLTESRVFWFYVRSILIPDIQQMSLFHDDFVISRSLFSPASTIIAILALALSLSIALLARNKLRILAFAVLFFFATHLLESTALPLELVHEHRNYVGSWALLLPPLYYFFLLAIRLDRPRAAGFLVVALLVALASGTRIRAEYWGDELFLARYQAHHSPKSIRVLLGAGAAFASHADQDSTPSYLDQALAYYLKVYKLDPAKSKALVSIISILYKKGDASKAQPYIDKLIDVLQRTRISADTMNGFIVVGRCLAGSNCSFPLSAYKAMAQALLRNPTLEKNREYAGKVLAASSNFAYLEGDLEAAIQYGERAIGAYPEEPQFYLNQAMVLIASGRMRLARLYLDQALTVDDSQFVRQRVASLEELLQQRQNTNTTLYLNP